MKQIIKLLKWIGKFILVTLGSIAAIVVITGVSGSIVWIILHLIQLVISAFAPNFNFVHGFSMGDYGWMGFFWGIVVLAIISRKRQDKLKAEKEAEEKNSNGPNWPSTRIHVISITWILVYILQIRFLLCL